MKFLFFFTLATLQSFEFIFYLFNKTEQLTLITHFFELKNSQNNYLYLQQFNKNKIIIIKNWRHRRLTFALAVRKITPRKVMMVMMVCGESAARFLTVVHFALWEFRNNNCLFFPENQLKQTIQINRKQCRAVTSG